MYFDWFVFLNAFTAAKFTKFKLQAECLISLNVFLWKYDTYVIQIHDVEFGTFCLFHFRQEDFYITTENYPEFLAPCMGCAPFVGQGCGIVGTCPLWSVWATTKMTCVHTTVTLGPLYILPTDPRNSIYSSHDNSIIKMWSKGLVQYISLGHLQYRNIC